jgi:hypothetical protein
MTTLLFIFYTILLAVVLVSLWMLERMPRFVTEGQRALAGYYIQELQTERRSYLKRYHGLFSKSSRKTLDNHS